MVFDKTGTLTKGVFEVTAVHHSDMDEQKLLEYAALAECASSHPISKSLQKAYGKAIDRSRVTDIQESSGHGVTAVVDGHTVAAGNSKLMVQLGIPYHDCHSVGTIIHMAVDGQYAGHIVISDVVKPNAKAAIAALHKAGVEKTVMLTGDAKEGGGRGGGGAGRGRGAQRAAARGQGGAGGAAAVPAAREGQAGASWATASTTRRC